MAEPARNNVNFFQQFLHNTHAMALNNGGENFKPIQASARAAAMALAACCLVRIAESFITPRVPFRWEVSMIAKGAPCIYAASIIATASYNYTLFADGKPIEPPPKTDTPKGHE